MESASRGIVKALSSNIAIDVCLVSSFAILGFRSHNQQNDIAALEAEKEVLTNSNKLIRKTLWDWKHQLYADASLNSPIVPLSRLRTIYGESPAPSQPGDTVNGGEGSSGTKLVI